MCSNFGSAAIAVAIIIIARTIRCLSHYQSYIDNINEASLLNKDANISNVSARRRSEFSVIGFICRRTGSENRGLDYEIP